MIANAGVSAVLATGTAMIYDLVTLTITRGRCHQFDGSGNFLQTKVIKDSVRWTNAPRPLRTSSTAPGGSQVFDPLAGVAYQRGTLSSKAGAEVLQVAFSVAGTLPITLATAQDGSGAFATSLSELALLGMLDGATLTIDQVMCTALPSTPVSAGAGYGIVSPDPVRIFSGILRGVKPNNDAVEFDACDPLILGGGSVPRNLFSPLCRWEFAGGKQNGVGCPVIKKADSVFSHNTTHVPMGGDSAFIQFQDGLVYLPGHLKGLPWAFLVPQDGPMMGMRFQIGNETATDYWYELADTLPWTWSCTTVHIERSCSRSYAALTTDQLRTHAPGCTAWDSAAGGGVLGSFGGSPDMPQPESA